MNRQRGYFMFELMLATAVATAMLVAALPYANEKIEERLSEAAASELVMIGESAQVFRARNGTWPDQAGNCAGAIAAIVGAGLLGGVDGTGIWGTAITTSCVGGNTFTLVTNAPYTRFAQYAATFLHTVTVSGTEVTTVYPLPGVEPALDSLLHRDAVAGRPELNRMNTAIDMNNNNITNGGRVTSNLAATDAFRATAGGFQSDVNGVAFNAPTGTLRWANSEMNTDQGGSIELGGINSTPGTGTSYIDFHFNTGAAQDYSARIINDADGRLTLNTNGGLVNVDNDVQVGGDLLVTRLINADDVVATGKNRSLEQAVTDVFLADNNAAIPKPTCGGALVPRIYTGISQAAEGATAGPIHQVATFAVDNGATWTARMQVMSTDGVLSDVPAGYGRIMVLTKCD